MIAQVSNHQPLLCSGCYGPGVLYWLVPRPYGKSKQKDKPKVCEFFWLSLQTLGSYIVETSRKVLLSHPLYSATPGPMRLRP